MVATPDLIQLGAVAVTALVVGIAAASYVYIHHYTLAYNDVRSHLAIARRVLDNRNPGLVQLGTVWLPIPHLLLLPFVQNDTLWHTGLAGSILGVLCLVVTAVALFASVRIITGRSWAAWVGIAVLLTAPNLLYLHSVALTEPVLMMMMAMSTYGLLRWERSGSIMVLTGAAVSAAFAVGSRYDGWFFALFSAALIAIAGVRSTGRPAHVEGVTLTYLIVPVYAMSLWLLFNWTFFGDPLAFQRGELSDQVEQLRFAALGLPSTQFNLLLSVGLYGWSVIDTNGVIITLCAAIGAVLYTIAVVRQRRSVLPYALVSVFPFNVLSLFAAQSAIHVPQLPPMGLFNVRYGVMMLPACAVFIAYLAARASERWHARFVLSLVAVVIGAQMALWAPGWPEQSLVVLNEGLNYQGENGSTLKVAEYLNMHYTGGGVMLDDTKNTVISLARLDIKEYIATFSGEAWRQALIDPAPYAAMILVAYTQDDLILKDSKRNPYLFEHYTIVLETDKVRLYQRV